MFSRWTPAAALLAGLISAPLAAQDQSLPQQIADVMVR